MDHTFAQDVLLIAMLLQSRVAAGGPRKARERRSQHEPERSLDAVADVAHSEDA